MIVFLIYSLHASPRWEAIGKSLWIPAGTFENLIWEALVWVWIICWDKIRASFHWGSLKQYAARHLGRSLPQWCYSQADFHCLWDVPELPGWASDQTELLSALQRPFCCSWEDCSWVLAVSRFVKRHASRALCVERCLPLFTVIQLVGHQGLSIHTRGRPQYIMKNTNSSLTDISSSDVLGISLSLWVPAIWALFSVVEPQEDWRQGIWGSQLSPEGQHQCWINTARLLGCDNCTALCNSSGMQAQQFVLIGAVRDAFCPWLVHSTQGPVLWA